MGKANGDVFDALTSERSYKKPLGFVAAMEILDQWRGIPFDSAILDVFQTIACELYDRPGKVKRSWDTGNSNLVK